MLSKQGFHACHDAVFPSAPLTVKHLTFTGKVKGLYDAQAPACPVCKAALRPGELQEHMEQELAKLTQLQIRYHAHALRILGSLFYGKERFRLTTV